MHLCASLYYWSTLKTLSWNMNILAVFFKWSFTHTKQAYWRAKIDYLLALTSEFKYLFLHRTHLNATSDMIYLFKKRPQDTVPGTASWGQVVTAQPSSTTVNSLLNGCRHFPEPCLLLQLLTGCFGSSLLRHAAQGTAQPPAVHLLHTSSHNNLLKTSEFQLGESS